MNHSISLRSIIKVNYFKIKSGLSQEEWEEKGWINEQDPRGWFHGTVDTI